MTKIKKQWIIFFICFLMIHVVSGYGYEGQANPSEWAKESILLLSSHGLLTEELLEDRKYQIPITREEFSELALAVYIKAMNISADEIDTLHPFTDTTNPNIGRAYNLGIIKGISDRKFAPNQEITRQEIATILWRQINVMGLPTELHKKADFVDMFWVARWAKEAVSFLAQEGFMMGIGNNRIAPNENTTREQAMVLLTNMSKKYGWLYVHDNSSDFEMLENGYLIPSNTELLIRVNEATKLHLQLTTDPYAQKESLRGYMEEILDTLRINKISEIIVMKLKQKLEDSWHEAYNAPVLYDPYNVELDDGRRIELRCDKGIDVTIYTPLFHRDQTKVIDTTAFKELSNGYFIPKESKLFIQSDDGRGIRLNLLANSYTDNEEIYGQISQLLDTLEVNKISLEIIQEIERKLSSSWDHIENKPGKIEITYRELSDGNRLVYSSDRYMQVKIFHMDL